MKNSVRKKRKASRPGAARHCSPDAPDLALPVLPESRRGPRPSRASKWRAFSLMAVHVLMIAHFLHWWWAGETVTPIEPSEAMETIRDGAINAGFIFFGLALLATMLLGRWVCGWGCHLVAYQDLTLWVLKKLRLRPKAFRSRLLLFVPLLAALYMFVWPAVARRLSGMERPPAELHVMTTGFWDTFPQYGIAILTVLVCGVAMIYFLGPKGFCTYACPYGAFFALLDRFAVGRIRVTDACRQCGHCTAVCTSNVRVAEEVKLYGMVVDPGCMKCLDCVTVCPNDALYFGFGRPAWRSAPRAPRRPIRLDFSWGGEWLALLIFAIAFLCFRGLYGKVPFLMSLGVAAVVTYLLMKALRLFGSRDVLIQRTRLKAAGRMRPWGYAYAALAVAVAAWTVHAGVWRYHDYLGRRAFDRSPGEAFGWPYGPQRRARLTEPQRQAVRAGLTHLGFCQRWGLVSTIEHRQKAAWLLLQENRPADAADQLRRALDQSPQDATLWVHLAQVETFRGELAAARRAFSKALAIEIADRAEWTRKLGDRPMEFSARLWAEWGQFLTHLGDVEQAAAALRWAVEYDPGSSIAWLALAAFESRVGNVDAARSALVESIIADAQNAEAIHRLHELGRTEQNFAAAERDYLRAVESRPDAAVFHRNRGFALARLRRYDEAVTCYRRALELQPPALDVHADLGGVWLAMGNLPSAAWEYEQILIADPRNAEAALRLGFLYAQLGRTVDAGRVLKIAEADGDESQQSAARSLLEQLNPAENR